MAKKPEAKRAFEAQVDGLERGLRILPAARTDPPAEQADRRERKPARPEDVQLIEKLIHFLKEME